MTRITNFGRKRTYLEAGFHDEDDAKHIDLTGGSTSAVTVSTADSASAPKKLRKGAPKPGGHEGAKSGDGSNVVLGKDGGTDDKNPSGTRKFKGQKTQRRQQAAAHTRATRTDIRRLKRQTDRQAETTCFACREKGHRAVDCPTAGADGGGGDPNKSDGKVVGICYRCGSRRHTLSRCKKPVDASDPLPFASCFVCSGKGHLASSCPQNQGKGIYPNGGCCKICGDTTHLAKDCGLRKDEPSNKIVVFGTDFKGGADEDDFHTFNRRKVQVEKDEKSKDKGKRSVDIKARPVKQFAPKSTKKVVNF